MRRSKSDVLKEYADRMVMNSWILEFEQRLQRRTTEERFAVFMFHEHRE